MFVLVYCYRCIPLTDIRSRSSDQVVAGRKVFNVDDKNAAIAEAVPFARKIARENYTGSGAGPSNEGFDVLELFQVVGKGEDLVGSIKFQYQIPKPK